MRRVLRYRRPRHDGDQLSHGRLRAPYRPGFHAEPRAEQGRPGHYREGRRPGAVRFCWPAHPEPQCRVLMHLQCLRTQHNNTTHPPCWVTASLCHMGQIGGNIEPCELGIMHVSPTIHTMCRKTISGTCQIRDRAGREFAPDPGQHHGPGSMFHGAARRRLPHC